MESAVIRLSQTVPARVAAAAPIAIPAATAKAKAVTESSSVAGRRSRMRSATGRCIRCDTPRSSVATRET